MKVLLQAVFFFQQEKVLVSWPGLIFSVKFLCYPVYLLGQQTQTLAQGKTQPVTGRRGPADALD